MKLILTEQEKNYLKEQGISTDEDITEDDALELLDKVHDIEVMYAQMENEHGSRMAKLYERHEMRLQSVLLYIILEFARILVSSYYEMRMADYCLTSDCRSIQRGSQFPLKKYRAKTQDVISQEIG